MQRQYQDFLSLRSLCRDMLFSEKTPHHERHEEHEVLKRTIWMLLLRALRVLRGKNWVAACRAAFFCGHVLARKNKDLAIADSSLRAANPRSLLPIPLPNIPLPLPCPSMILALLAARHAGFIGISPMTRIRTGGFSIRGIRAIRGEKSSEKARF
jgi:hypothetical protein